MATFSMQKVVKEDEERINGLALTTNPLMLDLSNEYLKEIPNIDVKTLVEEQGTPFNCFLNTLAKT
jgi:hypothetical protein